MRCKFHSIFRFVTESFVLALGMYMLGMETIDAVPSDSPAGRSKAEKDRWFKGLCLRIAESLVPIPPAEIEAMASLKPKYRKGNYCRMIPATYNYCVCKEGIY